MRIAVVAPLFEAVPPKLYGGTERLVSCLTEELVRRRHDVTLFASGDSETAANLVPCVPRSLRLGDGYDGSEVATLQMLSQVYACAGDFDVVHNHTDWWGFPFARLTNTPTVTTTHGRLDLPEISKKFTTFAEQPLVAISNDQRSYLPQNNWVGTVYNGIDCATFEFNDKAGDYLVFVGRVSPEKRPDLAVEIAERAQIKLVVAAKVDAANQDYYDDLIAPLFRHSPYVEFVGEVDDVERNRLLGGALANIFPIDWPEPFGLTMAESMATGTPVIATNRGSVPEVVVDGKTGFICSSIDQMVAAVARAAEIDRQECRRHVEENFSVGSMVDGYTEVYERLTAALD